MKTTKVAFETTTENGLVFSYKTAQNYFSVTVKNDGALEEVYDVYMGDEVSKAMQYRVFKAVKEYNNGLWF